MSTEPAAAHPDDLRRYASAVRSAGIFGFMSSSLKEALKVHLDIQKSPRKATKTQVADELTAVADHLAALKDLQEDSGLTALFGRRFKGLETDDELGKKCAALGNKIRAALMGYQPTTVEIRHLVLAADDDRLKAVAALRDHVLTDEVRNAASDTKDASQMINELPDVLRGRANAVQQYSTAAIRLGLPDTAPLSSLGEIVASMLSASEALDGAAHPQQLLDVLGPDLPSPRSDLSLLERAVASAAAVRSLEVAPEAREFLERLSPRRLMDGVVPSAAAIVEAAQRAKKTWDAGCQRLDIRSELFLGGEMSDLPIDIVLDRLRRSNAQRDELGDWIAYLAERNDARSRGLDDLLALWDRREVSIPLRDAVDQIFFRCLTREAFARYPELSRLSGLTQEGARTAFKALDVELTDLGRSSLVAALLRRPIPQGNGNGKRSEFTELELIHAELSKKKRHIPIRTLLDRAGNAVQAMKPVFMMSPLSVAQYVAPTGLRFDLLVIDEASQMRPEDAVGAIARCAKMVVVGDPKQLAPTGFFDRSAEEVDEDDFVDDAIDAESVLDQALACFRPARRLRWHYRSRHGSLIAFSNKEFYDNDLIVFPSPASAGEGQGVTSHFVEGIYKARSNVPEAMAICEAAVHHMKKFPHRSLGIATLNAPQRQIIEDEMSRLETSNPIVESYMQRWADTLERFFVKNLENVQGDERDAIYVSTVFGPSVIGGPVRQNFGPINGSGGHRRLNVLFTRAKYELRVFTSMRPEQITAGPDSPRGARVLRNYLSYAASGRLEAGSLTGRQADSDFEIFVRDRIQAAGYECEMQVGVAGFFIDLAVRDPERPDVFILGVECDGASYHSSSSARDRDVLRQQLLEGLGWKIYRIWSTDWFRNPNGETAKLLQHLDSLRFTTTRDDKASGSSHSLVS